MARQRPGFGAAQGGDFDTLVRSVTGQLWPFGDEVRFVPGHGPMSTFGDERRGNPFAGDVALQL